MFSFISVTRCVEIKTLEVPELVLNGSLPKLILDCDFELSNEKNAKDIVVQWWYNRQARPVYQWIPSNKPQVRSIIVF